MLNLFTIRWEKVIAVDEKLQPNVIKVRVTGLDESGQLHRIDTFYKEWLGVCTKDIQKTVRLVQDYFPGVPVTYEEIGLVQKVLPYFEDRLPFKLDIVSKPFYKLFIPANIEDVGHFLNKKKFAHYEKIDWLVRIYIDLSNNGFYYKWYQVDTTKKRLTEAFRMLPERIDIPPIKIAAFDIETVPIDGEDRVPTGMDSNDRIVMISIVKWTATTTEEVEEHVLYLNPPSTTTTTAKPIESWDPRYRGYTNEALLLKDFHELIRDCHVLTGYNINNFDIPCILARLLWLNLQPILHHYTSRRVGDYIICTFANKIVLDLYDYVHIFSSYDLSSLKLDVVARTKLGKEFGKIEVDSIGIHAWYTRGIYTDSQDRQTCHDLLKPNRVAPERFGTFREYVYYCLIDSDRVRRLFIKENVLNFLITRANFAAIDMVQALHFGNSKFLLELLKSYGTRLGFFVNALQNKTDGSKFQSIFVNNTYQGALNYCQVEQMFQDITVMDFEGMYPTTILSSNLSYETCSVLSTAEYLNLPVETRNELTAIPYRTHSEKDLETRTSAYIYPEYDPMKDPWVIVIYQKKQGFLPKVVEHFIQMRKHHQREFKKTGLALHYNMQLCLKITINSLYGIMASQESPLGDLVIAMTTVGLSRYQLLGAHHFVQSLGYRVVYADTDSLMVQGWPYDHCDAVNRYLSELPYVNLKFEQRMDYLLILSKKRYVYQIDGKIFTKGFMKKINELVQFISDRIVTSVMNLKGIRGDPGDGWILWVETLQQAQYMCRDPKKYCISRKTKKMEEYKSTNCVSVQFLQKYPDKAGQYVDFAYSRTDGATHQISQWVMDINDIKYVNFKQLFKNQHKIFTMLLNIGYWNMSNPEKPCEMVMNTFYWKNFVHAELLDYFKTGERLLMLVISGVNYTFEINDHVIPTHKRKSVVERTSKKIKT